MGMKIKESHVLSPPGLTPCSSFWTCHCQYCVTVVPSARRDRPSVTPRPLVLVPPPHPTPPSSRQSRGGRKTIKKKKERDEVAVEESVLRFKWLLAVTPIAGNYAQSARARAASPPRAHNGAPRAVQTPRARTRKPLKCVQLRALQRGEQRKRELTSPAISPSFQLFNNEKTGLLSAPPAVDSLFKKEKQKLSASIFFSFLAGCYLSASEVALRSYFLPNCQPYLDLPNVWARSLNGTWASQPHTPQMTCGV